METSRHENVLQVRLLGAPEVLLAGVPVRFDTRKAVALIAYLAITARSHTRDDLAALLWPESDRVKARSALRRTLSVAGAVGPALRVERAHVSLNLGVVDCDVARFTAGIDAEIEAAGVALDAYRGDFLEGFSLRDSVTFEDWSAAVRDRLRRDLDRLLTRLVDFAAGRGDFGPALDLARRRVALDPLNEAAHRSLIALYDWAGQRSESLQQYRRCVRVLERELGVAPLPETTAVYDAVRRRTLEPPAVPGDISKRHVPEDLYPEPPPPVAAQSVFVGRAEEVAVLERSWHEAAGTGQSCAVVGEVGSGKTALLHELARRISERGGHLVMVRGHEGEQSLAYAATSDLLRSLMQATPGLPELVHGHDLEALATVVPAWAEGRTRGVPDSGWTAADRGRVFGAVREVIVALRQAVGPVLLVAEDAHWIDAESLDLLAYLMRRPLAGVMAVVSWRGSASPAAVAAAVSDAIVDGRGGVVRLGPLTPVDVRALLTAQGHPADDGTVAEVLSSTGGLPLLVVERAQRGPVEAGSWRSLDTLVQARLDGAPETTRQVVTAVAVAAAPVGPDLLRAVSGRSDAEVVAALEDAVARGLLVEHPDLGEYDVPHETLRRLAADGTSLARRRLLHARAADALARMAGRTGRGPRWSGSVARHLELAGRFDEAAEWHARAARDASVVYAHASAESHLAAALALGYDSWTCHLGLGDARLRQGRYQEALAAYEQAAALAATDADLAGVEHRLAGVRRRLGEPSLAANHLEGALALLAAQGEAAARAAVLADLALVSLDGGRPADARRYAEDALAGAGADHAALAQAANVLGVLEGRAGDLDLARAHLQESLKHADALPDPGQVVATLNNLARVEAEAGRLDDALAAAAAALDRGSGYGDTHRTAALHTNLADLLHRAGREEEARDHQRQAAVLFAAVDSGPERRPEIWKLVEW